MNGLGKFVLWPEYYFQTIYSHLAIKGVMVCYGRRERGVDLRLKVANCSIIAAVFLWWHENRNSDGVNA